MRARILVLWALPLIVLLALGVGRSRAAAAAQEKAEEAVEGGEPEDLSFPGCTNELPESLKGLADPEKQAAVRKAALERRGAAVPDLVRALTCCDEVVRWQAVDLLGTLAAAEAIDALLDRTLTDPGQHVRLRAAWALHQAKRDDEVRAKAMARMTQPPTPEQRWRAAALLAQFHEPACLPILYEGLLSQDDMHRWEAAFLLRIVNDANTVGKLLPLAKDPSATVREQLLVTLASVGDAKAVPTIVPMLDDPEPTVRARAGFALAKLGDASVLPALEARLAKEQDAMARTLMRHAITQIRKRAQ
jgi:HEAT repeat protein